MRHPLVTRMVLGGAGLAGCIALLSGVARAADSASIPGDSITVIGQADASGNVTATRISEGDAAFGGFVGGARPSGAPTP